MGAIDLLLFWKKNSRAKIRNFSYGDRYYEAKCNIGNLEYIKRGISDTGKHKKLSPKEIKMFNISFGLNEQQVMAKLGKPNYKLRKRVLGHVHKIFFYRIESAEFLSFVQVHFFDNNFYMGKCYVKDATKISKSRIERVISGKYLGSNQENVYNYSIADKNNNRLEVNDSIHFLLTYVSGDQALYQKIYDLADRLQDMKHEKENKEYNLLFETL